MRRIIGFVRQEQFGREDEFLYVRMYATDDSDGVIDQIATDILLDAMFDLSWKHGYSTKDSMESVLSMAKEGSITLDIANKIINSDGEMEDNWEILVFDAGQVSQVISREYINEKCHEISKKLEDKTREL